MRLIDADALWMDIIHSMDYCDDILEIIERQQTIETEQQVARDIATIIENEKDMRVVLQQPQWISCSERLPQIGTQVLCCNRKGSVFTSAITYISNGIARFGQHYGVTAWMPLPESYKGDKDGE